MDINEVLDLKIRLKILEIPFKVLSYIVLEKLFHIPGFFKVFSLFIRVIKVDFNELVDDLVQTARSDSYADFVDCV